MPSQLVFSHTQDLRHAARLIAKSPLIAVVIAVTLALGIGVNAAIFSVVNGFLVRPLPVHAPQEIVVLAINDKNAPIGSSGFSYPQFAEFRDQTSAQNSPWAAIFANAITNVQLTARERSDNVFGVYVSGNFFPALGVQPALGRFMLGGESETANGPREIVLGYSYWQKRFGGDPSVIGGQVLINGKPATVVGVAAKSFHGMFTLFEMDVYLPISAMTTEVPPNFLFNSRDIRRFLVFGRLKTGASVAQAQSSIVVITRRLATQYTATDRWTTVCQQLLRCHRRAFSYSFRFHPSSRVSQYRKHSSRSRRRSPARDGNPFSAWRNSGAVDPPVAHRDCFSFRSGRRARDLVRIRLRTNVGCRSPRKPASAPRYGV
jgi:hypothetical protein